MMSFFVISTSNVQSLVIFSKLYGIIRNISHLKFLTDHTYYKILLFGGFAGSWEIAKMLYCDAVICTSLHLI